MEHLRAAVWGLLLIVAATAARGGTAWVCGLSDEGTRLICVADPEPAAGAAAAPATTAVVNGTRFPLDAARVYMVDLWSPPTEAEFVHLLARATICYRSPDCQVTMAPGPWLTATAGGPAARQALARR
jgi:hypothetical protein